MAIEFENPIPWETIEAAITDWIARVLDLETVWANQAEPQAPRPFAMVSITGPVVIGLADEKRMQEKVNSSGDPINEWAQKTVGQREITIGIQIEVDRSASQDPRRHARALATRLQSSLMIDDITRDLELAGLAYREPMPVQDVSIVIGAEFVNRALFEFRAGLASTVTEDIYPIEKAELEGTIEGGADGGSFTREIEVDSTT
jgi:hypothetical protein